MIPTPRANRDESGKDKSVEQDRARDSNDRDLDRLLADIDIVRADSGFTSLLHDLIERDGEILDRLAE